MMMMTTTTSVLFACAAMLLLVCIVSARLIAVRAKESSEKRLHPQKLANSKQVAELLPRSTQVSDNYRNLFELPVLFYLLCALIVGTHTESAVLTYGVWFFVALRYAHSFIHCTYNKVMHRFPVFAAGFGVLLVLWFNFLKNQL
jgi:hypothetical protein